MRNILKTAGKELKPGDRLIFTKQREKKSVPSGPQAIQEKSDSVDFDLSPWKVAEFHR